VGGGYSQRSPAATAAASRAAALDAAARVAAAAAVRHVSLDLHNSMMAAYEAREPLNPRTPKPVNP